VTTGRRRVLAVVLVIAAVIGLRLIGQARRHDAATDRAAATATVTASPSASPSPSGAAAPGVAESGPHEEADPVAAAETWVATWLNTSGGNAAWLVRLQPLTDPPLFAGLAQTDVKQVPGGGKAKVLPGTRVAPSAGQADVTARVQTTAGAFDVTLTIRDEKWIVTLNDRAR
jgi:hypothetical protein